MSTSPRTTAQPATTARPAATSRRATTHRRHPHRAASRPARRIVKPRHAAARVTTMRPDQRVPSLRPLVVPPSKTPKQRPSPWWLALPVAFPLLLVAAVSALAARRRIRSRRAEEARMADLEAGLQEIVAEARAARRSVER